MTGPVATTINNTGVIALAVITKYREYHVHDVKTFFAFSFRKRPALLESLRPVRTKVNVLAHNENLLTDLGLH